MTAVVACPKCGAPSATAQKAPWTCSFCGAIVAEEQPKVVERIIERVVLVEKGSSAKLPCPRCEVPLFEGRAQNITLHGCGTCGGVWLDNEGSLAVMQQIPPSLLELADRAARASRGKPDHVPHCPIDKAILERVTVKGVDLDVCKAHGTWFDAGEVRRIAQAYASERIDHENALAASAGGISYDYSPDAREALQNQQLLARLFKL
jgi:Zn-finger nucleic acid-binding protein